MEKRERLESEGEITPAMIDAGLEEFFGYDPEGDIADDAVKRIFLAMLRARPVGRDRSHGS